MSSTQRAAQALVEQWRASLHSHHQQHPEWSVPAPVRHTPYWWWTQNLWIGLSANAASAGMVLSPDPNPTVGTSADVFAWDENGNGVIDTGEYYWSSAATPVANFAIEVLAVPEPASMIALGSGLVGLLALRRRRQRV
jgi:hypothetical protein